MGPHCTFLVEGMLDLPLQIGSPMFTCITFFDKRVEIRRFSISFCDQSTDYMMMQSCNCILAPITWMVHNLQQDGGIFVLFQLVNCFWAIYCSKHFTFCGMEYSIIHSLFLGGII